MISDQWGKLLTDKKWCAQLNSFNILFIVIINAISKPSIFGYVSGCNSGRNHVIRVELPQQ